MKNGCLLDTNILIYLSQGNEKVKKALQRLNQEFFFISVISYFEFLDGHKTPEEFALFQERLQNLAPLDFTREIAKRAAELDRLTNRKIKLKGLFIAATAEVEKLTLVTADKGFKRVKGLKVKLLEP